MTKGSFVNTVLGLESLIIPQKDQMGLVLLA